MSNRIDLSLFSQMGNELFSWFMRIHDQELEHILNKQKLTSTKIFSIIIYLSQNINLPFTRRVTHSVYVNLSIVI